ncbi:MaoC family dehydratase N-terminal domain-containing protein [Streptomyces sp. NPDC090052]|uniref:MaoC family dehydratase N-terminal domain-containing protein n=1 Tax=unclassified Streptomyces TaxID=2593676 RepID=UPI00224F41BD|nr:MaoC family dehydratase N-terminal domain-containing protein [Streptomyces sp. NBC_01306]MCX4728821.1 MaoC family dehydratase N-terminal domain-containing protein [Streptomyces sp. NBC_01306]WSX46455.1 MaoC family dehydratase N-terminal domain-containing protein [Streptomyces sp. NBC_00963]
MPVDPSIIGSRSPEHSVEVERGRLRFFAKATGQNGRVYTDPEAAEQAGHRDLPVPPTFLVCLDAEKPDSSSFLRELGIDIRTILHGEQSFEYHALAYAGDRLTFATEVSDVYEKKGGALQFIVRTTEVTRDRGHRPGSGGPEGELVARIRNTVVVRELPAKEATA